MEDKHTVYLDGVDFEHEIGHASGGNRVYPSVNDLKRNNPCWDRCGIVKAEVTLVEWIHPQDFTNLPPDEDDGKAQKQIHLEHLERLKDYHAKMLASAEQRIKELTNE